MKSRIYTSLRIIISFSFIGLLFYIRKDTLGLTLEAIKRIEPILLLLSCVLFIISIIALAFRLKVLFYGQRLFLKSSETIYLTFIGLFFNNFLPTSIGGDVVKAYYAFKKTGDKLGSFISIFMDRFIGSLTLFLLAGLSLFFSYTYIKSKYLVWVTVTISLLLLFILIIFFNKKTAKALSSLIDIIKPFNIRERLQKIYNAINAYKDKKDLLLKAAAVSIATQIASFFVMYLLSKGIGVYIPMKMVLLLMPLVSTVSMLPSINGLGIREGAIYFLFGPYIGYKNAFALSLLSLFMLFLTSIIGGLIYLLGTPLQYKRELKKEELIR